MKRVYQREEVCIGCRLCEVGCITEHSASKHPVKAFKQSKVRPESRNRVEECGPLSVSVNCRHCEDPACVQICISGALTKDRGTGIVRHNAEKCVGCWSCIMVCPIGVIRKKPGENKVMKCDLCPDRSRPACVEACPNRALIYEDL